ncbi:MAG: hypothetical protein AB7K71_10175 [Polyangiaceae bacterium]
MNCSTVAHVKRTPRRSGSVLFKNRNEGYQVQTSAGVLNLVIDDEVTRIQGTGVVATLEPAVKEVHLAVQTCGTTDWSTTRRSTVYP